MKDISQNDVVRLALQFNLIPIRDWNKLFAIAIAIASSTIAI